MRILLGLLLALGVGVLALRLFLATPPAELSRLLRLSSGVALILAAVGLAVFHQFALALPIGAAGVMILRRQARIRVAGTPGDASQVRSAALAMRLDHATGEMDGEVLTGRHERRLLSELSLEMLLEVAADLRGDAQSLRLLEAYLDRSHSGWRDDVQHDEARRERPAPAAGGMDAQEAYQLLGLEPGASEAQVREAHRRLMKQVHPDRGGSSALAAKINEAKNRILGRHR
jgi:hypothetical protein